MIPHSSPRCSFERLVLPFLALVLMAAPLAFAAAAAGSGEISGRISSAETGNYLANVRVIVAGTNIRGLTDATGEYRLRGVPAGPARIVASSTGAVQEAADVVVEPGQVVRKNFALPRSGQDASGKIVELDPFSVQASILNARAVAINEQRYAPNIKNVISADMFGDIGEGNIAEFLKFVPGVAIDYSANVGAGVSIRGFPSSNTLVTMDGADMPSAGVAVNQVPTNQLATRTVTLDALRMNNISRVEVTKSPTPDLPANSMGGSVNVISRSAFELARPEFEIKAFMTFNSRNFREGLDRREGSRPELDARPIQPGFKFSYTKPVSKDFGFSFSGSSFRRNYAYRSSSTSWNLDGANAVLAAATIDAQEQLFTSSDAALNGEWRVGKYSTLKAGALYVDTTTHISDNKMTVEFGPGATGGRDFVQGAPNARGVAEIANPLGAKVNGRTYQGTLDYIFKRDDWVIRASGFMSRNAAKQQDVSKGFFNRVDLALEGLILRAEGFGGGMAGTALPRTITATDARGNPVDIFDGGLYQLSRVITRPMTTVDAKNGAKLDVTRYLGRQLTLKAGVAYNRQMRDTLHPDFKRYDWNPRAAGSRTAGDFGLVDPEYSRTAQNYYPGKQVQWVSLAKVYELFKAQPEYFTLNEANSYTSTVRYSPLLEESITAGYIRADLKLLKDRLWLVGGVRYEKTKDKGDGPLQDFGAIYQTGPDGRLVYDANGRLIPIATGLERTKLLWTYRGQKTRRSYDDYYPSFNATYNLRENLLLRGAYAKTIGRPNLRLIIPGTVIADPSAPPQNRTITVVNAGLKPWTSDGYDLSLEYYGDKWGVATAGVFQKDIKNFFGGTRTRATQQLLGELNIPEDYPGQFDTYDIITTINVPGNVRIRGLEVAYQNSLAPLHRWLKNVSAFANATFLDLEGSKDSDFSGYWPKTFNWGVSYARPRLLVQLNWNVKPANALQPRGDDPTRPIVWSNSRAVVSGAIEYRFAKNFSAYFTADNITDVPRKIYRYGSQTPEYARLNSVSAFGVDMTLGLKATF